MMYEIVIKYVHKGYRSEIFHPTAFKYHEVVQLMDTIVCQQFNTSNVKWLDTSHNRFAIWIDGKCKGYARIRDVGPKTSEPDSERG